VRGMMALMYSMLVLITFVYCFAGNYVMATHFLGWTILFKLELLQYKIEENQSE
jgi:uncharacterized SAM-binding protein YcdF (DUF218 family)